MALTDRPTAERQRSTADAAGVAPRGFRPASRRRSRIAAGAVLAAIAIGGNVLLYASLDDKTEVLQLVRNVRAGETITSDDLRIVEVDVDPTVPVVEAGDIGLVINQYAKVFIASGSLMFEGLVQSTPLVSDGAGVVAVEIRPTRVPSGLVERSQVMIVVVPEGDDAELFVTTGRVVARGLGAADANGVTALSVEVAVADAPTIAAGNDIRIILVDPGNDPATDLGAGG